MLCMAEVLVPMTGILEAAGDFPTEAVFNVSVVENVPIWRIVGLMGLVQTWSAAYLIFVLVYTGGSSS